MFARFILAAALLLAPFLPQSASQKHVASLIEAMDCARFKTNRERLEKVEALDRAQYQPQWHSVTPIQMRHATEGYHGRVRGNYVFIVEYYPDESSAKKRADEYVGGWTQRVSQTEDRGANTDLSKSDVRCWGVADGRYAYLLTTHSSLCSALEVRKDSLKTLLVAHLQREK